MLAARHDDACAPAGGSSSEWGLDRLDIEPTARDQPRDHRVRVPHLACPQLVASPDGRRHLGRKLEQLPRAGGIVAEVERTLDRLSYVWDHAVAPASDLVTEEPEPACGPGPRRTPPGDGRLPAPPRAVSCLF